MPNTKSAEKRTRSSARKAARNQAVESRLKTLEKKFLSLVKEGKLTDAKTALQATGSAYAKGVKAGTVKSNTASRKRSRLQLHLNRASKTKPAV